jgi:hypothetical protein
MRILVSSPARALLGLGRGLAVVAVVVAVGLLAFPPQGPAHPTDGSAGVGVANGPGVALNVNWSHSPTSLSTGFWGADVRVYNSIGSSQATWWGETPLSYAVWPGGAVGDGFNYTSGVITSLGGSTYQAPQTTAQFVSWCKSVACHSIFQLPAEVDAPGLGASDVSYVENTLHYHPDYWEIGNEPARWSNFGLPWSEWGKKSGASIDPQTYAKVVQRYIAAVRAVDPKAQFLGLPGTGIGATDETGWLGATVALNGPDLSAVAIHVYPAGSGSGSASLSGFFGSLTGKGSLPARVPQDIAAIRAACPKCAPIPIFVTESNAANQGGIWDGYMSSYPEVPYMAAQLVQAIDTDVANLDLFSFEGAYPGSLFSGSGNAQPIFTFYSQVLSHFGSEALPTSLATREGGAYGQVALSSDRSTATLLLVNANASTPLSVALAGSGFPTSGPVHLYAWNDSNSEPATWTQPGGLGSTLSLSPASILLVSAPNSGSHVPPPSYPVRFTESGLPAGTAWSVTLAGTLLTSSNSTVGTSVANGTYTFTVTALPSWNPNPASGSLTVAGAGSSNVIYFTKVSSPPPQYLVTFEPTGSGSSAPWSVTLGNLTQSGSGTLAFSVPNGTYAFLVTPPSGMTAAPSQGTLTVAGASVAETVALQDKVLPPAEYTVTFVPAGLGAGVLWQVVLANSTQTANGNLVFSETNGTYGYSIMPPSGMRASPSSGSVNVSGANVEVAVNLTATQGAPTEYTATFVPSGLAIGANWSVTLGSSVASHTGDLEFLVLNGSYSFSIGAPTGTKASPSTGTIDVAGSNLTVAIQFVVLPPPPLPQKYLVRFVAAGLPAGGAWSVSIGNGSSNSSVGDHAIGFDLANGTYVYLLSGPSGFSPSVPSGTVVVAGSGWSLNVTFAPAPASSGPQPETSVSAGLPSDPLGHSWLFVSLLGLIAVGAVYGVERGLSVLHRRP